MYIGVYGSGYLGTVLSGCLADFGMPITCYDADHQRLMGIAQGKLPYFERNLDEVVKRNIRSGRLLHSSDVEACARKCHITFIAEDRSPDIEGTVEHIASFAGREAILVIVTPVPVGTARRIEARLRQKGLPQTVVSHPIFLTDGCAVEDFNWPDRILLGTTSSTAVMTLKQVYRPLVMRGVPVIVTSHETAELVREASTAFLATKVSFINELSALCEHVSADAVDLALALGLDKKIAPRCLQPGAVFGGAFVEHDMESLAQLASGQGISLKILGAAREVNQSLSGRITDKICGALDTVAGKQVGLLGLAFKPNTNSVAGSSSILLARSLTEKGVQVRAYDPVAMPAAMNEIAEIKFCESAYAAAEGVDALVLATGWPEFRALDFDRIKRLVKKPILVDTKNLLDAVRLRAMGFNYIGMGRA